MQTYVTSETGVDFSEKSSDTNGKGIYLLSSTKDDTSPIYYYRGAVTNNNVKFAGFCWKIVRTTETGGVKLIYNGVPDSNGYCTNTTGTSTQIGTGVFNVKSTDNYDNAYVGYMYGTIGATTYEETHKNTNDSSIKTTIDNWYKSNMIDYTEKLEDTVWCNDRKPYTGNAVGTNYTYYASYNRLGTNKAPSLICAQDNDKFTVSTTNGNGALTYPVALLTADEIAYAGGGYGIVNAEFYLYTNQYYLTMTPASLDVQTYVMELNSGGNIAAYYTNYDNQGVRPSVSLLPNTIASGDGTSTLPYTIY